MKTSKMEEIKVSEISTEGQMVRAEQDEDHILELANSIARHGLLEPIVVRKTDKGYQLIAGFHRLQATKRLHEKYIKANIIAEDSTVSIKSLALIENIIRKDMTLQEECQAINMLIEEEKKSISEICDVVGRGRAWVQKRIVAMTLQQNILDALFENLISIEVANLLGGIEDNGTRNQILTQAIYQKWTVSQVRQVVECLEVSPSLPEAIVAGLAEAIKVQEQKEVKKCCQACGKPRTYAELKPMWMCVDSDDCNKRIMEEVENANIVRR